MTSTLEPLANVRIANAMMTTSASTITAGPCRRASRAMIRASASVMPPVAGAMPDSAARASGSFAIRPYAAVMAAVTNAAGTIIPATDAITPRHPAIR